MTGRPSVGLADLEEVSRRIVDGAVQQPPRLHAGGVDLRLEPELVRGASTRFEDACAGARDPVRGHRADRRHRVGLPLELHHLLAVGAEPPLQPVEQHGEGGPHVVRPRPPARPSGLRATGRGPPPPWPGPVRSCAFELADLASRFRVVQLDLLDQVPDECHSSLRRVDGGRTQSRRSRVAPL